MADTLTGMADAGADIAKLAVMPHTAADAARLLEATARAAALRPATPLITMSMGAPAQSAASAAVLLAAAPPSASPPARRPAPPANPPPTSCGKSC